MSNKDFEEWFATASDLDKWHLRAAYEAGHKAGHLQGYNSGYDAHSQAELNELKRKLFLEDVKNYSDIEGRK
jgi:hypothetical protein